MQVGNPNKPAGLAADRKGRRASIRNLNTSLGGAQAKSLAAHCARDMGAARCPRAVCGWAALARRTSKGAACATGKNWRQLSPLAGSAGPAVCANGRGAARAGGALRKLRAEGVKKERHKGKE